MEEKSFCVRQSEREKGAKQQEAFDAKELESLKQCILKYGKDMEQEGISYDNEG